MVKTSHYRSHELSLTIYGGNLFGSLFSLYLFFFFLKEKEKEKKRKKKERREGKRKKEEKKKKKKKYSCRVMLSKGRVTSSDGFLR